MAQRRAAELRRAEGSSHVGAGAHVRDPERPTRLLTNASALAVSAILEQPDDKGMFILSSVRTLPTCWSFWRSFTYSTVLSPGLDKPFELHTDNASLQWQQQQRHVGHHQARWLKLLSEY